MLINNINVYLLNKLLLLYNYLMDSDSKSINILAVDTSLEYSSVALQYKDQITEIFSNSTNDRSKKLLDIFSKHKFIEIEIEELKNNLNDTENVIYSSNSFILKNYKDSEFYLKQLSDEKKNEDDFKILRKKLFGTYFSNMLLFSILPLGILIFISQSNFNREFFFNQLLISTGIILASSLFLYFIKNIY